MTVYKWAEMTSRERDELVARKVMGWRTPEHADYWLTTEDEVRTWDTTSFGSFRPSSDISAAWRVQDRFSEVTLVKAVTHIEMWRCEIYSFGELKGESPICVTAPEAICLAALRAVGVDVE